MIKAVDGNQGEHRKGAGAGTGEEEHAEYHRRDTSQDEQPFTLDLLPQPDRRRDLENPRKIAQKAM
jgi:hypothetical protein